ncbi:hypothetical protein SJI00_12470 [Pseudomonas sp. RP23018S]|uniref:hypothetical protein n=1 Tax=Pseudomonas sp. RP23018S TaxID=3096037 RepID=UPI002ACA6EEA|nr:hypothetical protein [Pseudomonas sp. RP23018S]MDZ5603589.1 hypothetical protein [Pseudomonas sp. RP23018S]
MKLHAAVSAKLAGLQPNQIGAPVWSLLAHPPVPPMPHYLGGVPGQPEPDYPQPTPPGEPTIPDEPPPTPMA